MKSFNLLLILGLLYSALSFGQDKISVPSFNDKYSNYVKKLENGETNIDYQDFRFSFIESDQFKIASKKMGEMMQLEKDMFEQMEQGKDEEVVRTARKILSIDYTNLMAHKILRQASRILGDDVSAVKYKTIQFGLLESITKKGDGTSCQTAWPVIQITEEYFILQMLDADIEEQSIYNTGGLCDKFVVKIDGTLKTYYFETTKVFESRK